VTSSQPPDAEPPDSEPPDAEPPPAEPPDSGSSSDGIVSIEVENYASNVGVGGHYWEPTLDSGASGGGSLQALPNSGTTRTQDYVVNSPRLDFDVNFSESGRYYVWVRGRGPSGKDDSLHVGLNGQVQSRGERISGFTSSWTWSGKTMGGNRASIDVSVAGAQQLTVWMREDGTEIDKIVLTRDSSLGPEEFGPLGPPATESDPPGGGANPPIGSQNTPPEISGTPPANIVEGMTYRFRPTLFDADGDDMTAAVSGLPRWATFSSSTGRIRGTPGPGDVGLFEDIVITVSDGQDQASLGPFSILVQAVASSSVTLTWTPPTTNTDGSPLTDLDGYELRWGPTGGNLNQSTRLSNPGLSRYVLDGIAPGDYEFVIFAINAQGVYSSPSITARASVR
jgi:hypothetical protein